MLGTSRGPWACKAPGCRQPQTRTSRWLPTLPAVPQTQRPLFEFRLKFNVRTIIKAFLFCVSRDGPLWDHDVDGESDDDDDDDSCKRRLQPPDPIDPKLPNRKFVDLYVSSCTLSSMILEEKGGVLFDFRNYRHLKWGFHTNLNSLLIKASLLTRVTARCELMLRRPKS